MIKIPFTKEEIYRFLLIRSQEIKRGYIDETMPSEDPDYQKIRIKVDKEIEDYRSRIRKDS